MMRYALALIAGAAAVAAYQAWQERMFQNEVRRVIAHANLICKEAA
jgi:hypothetical protein